MDDRLDEPDDDGIPTNRSAAGCDGSELQHCGGLELEWLCTVNSSGPESPRCRCMWIERWMLMCLMNHRPTLEVGWLSPYSGF